VADGKVLINAQTTVLGKKTLTKFSALADQTVTVYETKIHQTSSKQVH
jgi:hypothetical protein